MAGLSLVAIDGSGGRRLRRGRGPGAPAAGGTAVRCLGWLLALVLLAGPGAGAAADCAELAAAHAALLEGSFTVVREFVLHLNGELGAREVSRLSYDAGLLTRETLERETPKPNVVLEEGEKEAALAIPFACDRLEAGGEDRVALRSPDGVERVEFALDRERGALVPLAWETRETERFLWKKFEIEATAAYRDFEWR